MPRVSKIEFPAESRLRPRLATATFVDAFEAELGDPSLTALQIAQRAFSATPAWMDGLLRLRDLIIRPFGLKGVGAMGSRVEGSAPGDRLSIFEIESVDDVEVVLGIDDRHLDVRISFLKRENSDRAVYAICSLVRTHNLLGKAYMIPVGRLHPVLVRRMMAKTPLRRPSADGPRTS